MSNRTLIALVFLAIAGPIAFLLDRRAQRKRPREELEKILQERNWSRIGAALREIKRRGENLAPYLPIVLTLLTSDSAAVRTAGKVALKEHFPKIAGEIPTFEATAPSSIRAKLLAPLLKKYGAADKT